MGIIPEDTRCYRHCGMDPREIVYDALLFNNLLEYWAFISYFIFQLQICM